MAQKAFLINRYERKYVVDEHKARAIRDMVRCHFDPDEYMPPLDSEGYPVYSLYLDSARLTLYQATAQGMMNRFKLRVRYYDDLDSSPVFFEVKQRLNQTVRKQRALVKRSSLARLLGGHTPSPNDLFKDSPGALRRLEKFCELRSKLRARGTLMVGYLREAFVDPNGTTNRVTFDRHLSASPFHPDKGLRTELTGVERQIPGVVLELKYEERLPAWMEELVRMFGLERQSVPKYGLSIEAFYEPDIRVIPGIELWKRVTA